MRLHPSLFGLLIVAAALAYFGYTFTFPALPGQKYGPSLFPRVIAAGLVICGAVIAWQGRASGERWFALAPELREWRARLSFLAVLAAIGFYLLAAERAGFLPTATIVVAALAFWFGARWWGALLLGVASAAAIQWFFGSLMRVPLPRGWFMQFVAGG